MKQKTLTIQTPPLRKWVVVNKHLGKTPLESLDAWREENPEYKEVKMAYAGRLDPMAEGKLLVLVGEECKERNKYLSLDKEYEFEILLGVNSDTYDILGIVNPNTHLQDNILHTDIARAVSQLSRMRELPYPAYSSKTVEGKPLFLWALENRLDEIVIPTKEVHMYSLDVIDIYTLTQDEVLDTVRERIGRVTPVTEESKELGRDFRRKEVLGSWDSIETHNTQTYTVVKLRCVCSSGTYMRTLAHMLGERLGCGGLVWSIKRTRIGVYKYILRIWGMWTTTYE